MESCVITNARVYVTTKNRYVHNNRFGIWVKLSGFSRKKDFLMYCRGLFPDEQEPLIIHLDWQDIPVHFINENAISANVFRLIGKVREMEAMQQQGFAIWLGQHEIAHAKTETVVQAFAMCFMGYFGYKEQFGEYNAMETMGITREGSPRFDFISYTNQLFRDHFTIHSGFVFRKSKI